MLNLELLFYLNTSSFWVPCSAWDILKSSKALSGLKNQNSCNGYGLMLSGWFNLNIYAYSALASQVSAGNKY